MLEISNLCSGYGRAQVLHGIDLKIAAGEAFALLGRNGAGKSTLLKAIMNLVRIRTGQVCFLGRPISGLPSHRICRQGIGYVPEDRRIFAALSVEKNLQVGQLPPRPGLPAWTLESIYRLFPHLAERRDVPGQWISGGEQQMLAIARTLMGNPALILIDEMSEGLAPVVVEQLVETLQKLKSQGLTIVLSEQNLHVARLLADKACILESGSLKFTGRFSDLDAQPQLTAAHLSV